MSGLCCFFPPRLKNIRNSNCIMKSQASGLQKINNLPKTTPSTICSGQTFPKPELRAFSGGSLTQPELGLTLAEVAIRYNLLKYFDILVCLNLLKGLNPRGSNPLFLLAKFSLFCFTQLSFIYIFYFPLKNFR